MLAPGLDIAASGMIAQQQRLDATAGNVANAGSEGFEAQRTALVETPPTPGAPGGSGVQAASLGPDGQPGPLVQTGQPLDVAVTGGYLQVRRPGGQVALTRAGSLQLDQRGRLVTASGDSLVPPVQVPAGTDPSRIAIAPTGAVSVQGRPVGQITPVTVAAPNALLAAGNALLLPGVGSGPVVPASGATVQQGVLEGSNTDLVGSMVDLVETKDSFAASVTVARTQDDMLASLLGILP